MAKDLHLADKVVLTNAQGVARERDRWGGSAWQVFPKESVAMERSVTRSHPTWPPAAATLPTLRVEEGGLNANDAYVRAYGRKPG
jgi:hypothetical protein